MPAIRRFRARLGALLAGAVVTALGCALFAGGTLARIDDAGLDFHFRHFSVIKADPRIVLIDIDDSSLQAIGEWPWPRRRHAEIIRMLHKAGAKQIVYDIVFAEPAAPRFAPDELGPPMVGTESEPLVDDDAELAEAIAQAGNVQLALYGQLSSPQVDPHELIEGAARLIRESPRISHSSFREAMGKSSPWASEEFYDLLRVAAVLQRNFKFDPVSIAQAMPDYQEDDKQDLVRMVERVLPTAARFLARCEALALLQTNPQAKPEDLLIRRSARDGHSSPEGAVLTAAYDWGKSVAELQSRLPAASDRQARRLVHAFDLTPPISAFVHAAAGVGLVTFEREGTGGIVREVPLLAEFDGKLLPQLGFTAAAKELGIDLSGAEAEAGILRLDVTSGELAVPIGGSGMTLINWHVPGGGRWQESFRHIPAARVLEIADLRRAISHNAHFLAQRTAELVRLRHADTPAEYADYLNLHGRGTEILSQLQGGEAEAPGKLAAELQAIDARIRQTEKEAIAWLQHAWREWESAEPQNEEERAERAAIEELQVDFGGGGLEGHLRQTNAELRARVESLLQEIRSQVDGSTCFVGYTASTVADFIASPIYPSMPGVMAHASVANMLLQGKFVRRASLYPRIALAVAAGLLVTLLACAGGWRTGAVGLLAVGGLLFSFGWWQFAEGGIYLSTPVAAVIAASSWAVTTALRQGTEERARRRLQRALVQYTSPAIAARIAERISDEGLVPQAAQVTCFFADLRNFTAISEQLGPARTRDLLNPYLESVSRVLVAEGAMVNKFTGDGVFAFFNAPLHPCAEYARAGCRAALWTLRAVDSLAAPAALFQPLDGRGSNANPIGRLVVRVGLASGEAFVGDYGSNAKLDYTCIGDTVNVASRLEEANKFFGTRLLVDSATRTAAGAGFVFRYLGRVLLAGKELPTEVYELMGVSAESDGAMAEFTAAFEQVVRSYQLGDWDECATAIASCRALQPEDRPLAVYAEALDRTRTGHIPPGVSGTIRASII